MTEFQIVFLQYLKHSKIVPIGPSFSQKQEKFQQYSMILVRIQLQLAAVTLIMSLYQVLVRAI